ncbi:sugar ABC transporter substrate-binding protein [Actinomadura alba]
MTACMLATTLSLSLAACGGGDSGPGGDGSTIRLQVSGEPEEIAVYRALVGAYEKSHPGRRVRLDAVAKKSDHLARLTTSFAAGGPPDVFLVNYREYAQFVARRALSPVGPALTSRGVRMADYFPQPIEAFTYQGVLQCMPQNISSLVVYYNRELLSRAGVPAPKATWTWADFARTAKTLTRAGGHGVGIEPSLVRAAPFVWGAGGEVVDDTRSPTRLTLDTPQARRALDFLLGLAPAMPGEKEVAAQDLETRFTTGKLAMLLSSRRETPTFREVPGLDFDVAPLPTGLKPAGILHSDGYCVAAKSRRREAAAQFIAYAVGSQGQTLTALGGRTVPSLVSVARSGAFLDPTRPPKSSQVFLDGIPSIRRTPVHPRWPEVEDVVAAELTRVFHDGAPLDQALTRIDERTRPLLAGGA